MAAVFEVYLNGRRDLLVVEKGHPLPLIGGIRNMAKKEEEGCQSER